LLLPNIASCWPATLANLAPSGANVQVYSAAIATSRWQPTNWRNSAAQARCVVTPKNAFSFSRQV
jgi:hypothetical protein